MNYFRMIKYIILFFSILKYGTLQALPLSKLLFPQDQSTFFRTNQVNMIEVFSTYDDIYYYKNSKGEKQQVFNGLSYLKTNFWFYDTFLSLKYKKMKNKIYFNNLDAISDQFYFGEKSEEYSLALTKEFNAKQLTVDGAVRYDQNLTGSLGFTIPLQDNKISFNSALNTNYSYIIYNIKGISKKLDFNYYLWQNQISFKNSYLATQFSYAYLFPIESKNDFNNKIYGNTIVIKAEYESKNNLTSFFDINYNYLKGDFRYKEEQYGKIDGLQHLYFKFDQSYTFCLNHSLNLGLKGIFIWIEDDSYLDIWPFTFWDVFLSSRTRLSDFKNNIILPTLGYKYKLNTRSGSFQFNNTFITEYSHFIYYGQNNYKERYFVVYPILMSYRSKDLELTADIDGIINLSYASTVKYKNYSINIQLSQLLPFKKEYIINLFKSEDHNNEDGFTSSKSKKTRRGGTSIKIKLIYEF